MTFNNAYFITGTAYAGKSTMIKLLAKKYDGILCEENYHDQLLPELDSAEFPFLTYTRDLRDWHDFIRRSPEEYKAWMTPILRRQWRIIGKDSCSSIRRKTMTTTYTQGFM